MGVAFRNDGSFCDLILGACLVLHVLRTFPQARRDAKADFFGVALGVEGEKAGEDFIAKVGRPEQAALVGVVVLVRFVEEDWLGARGEVMPAVSFENRAVYGVVQVAKAQDAVKRLS